MILIKSCHILSVLGDVQKTSALDCILREI